MPRPLPAIARLFPGVFYGWVVTAGSGILAFVGVGIGFYSLPVLLDGLVQGRGWSAAAVSGATSVFFVVAAVTGSLVGRFVDRLGSRGFMLVGIALLATALVAIGGVRTPRDLVPCYALLAVGFALSSGVPNSAIITRWFVARRALAMSLSQTGVSFGGIVLVPVAAGIVEARGLAAATSALAALAVALALPTVLFVLRFDPRDHGLVPDGGVAPASHNPFLRAEVQQRLWTTAGALRTATFWILAASFSAVLFAQQGLSVHLIAYLRAPLGATTAALAVSTMAAGSVVARLVVGSFADRVDKRRLALGLVLVQASVYAVFGLTTERAALFGISFLFGCTIGNLYMFQSLLVGELFGMRSFGTVAGALTLVTQVLGGLGPWAVGALAEAEGDYALALRALLGAALLAAFLLLWLRPPALPARADQASNAS